MVVKIAVLALPKTIFHLFFRYDFHKALYDLKTFSKTFCKEGNKRFQAKQFTKILNGDVKVYPWKPDKYI